MKGPELTQQSTHPDKIAPVRLALGILVFVFALLLLAQLVQNLFDATPPIPLIIEDSDLLPFGWVFVAQIAVLGGLVDLTRRVDGTRRPLAGMILIVAGLFCLGTSGVRAVITVADSSAQSWWQMPVPIASRIVFGAALLLAGCHFRGIGDTEFGCGVRRVARPLIYPVFLAICVGLFTWCLDAGGTPAIASYAAVILGGVTIVIAELLLPYREAWQPSRGDVFTDAVYLGVVQVALPACLTAAVVLAVARYDLAIVQFWPRDLPIAFQVLIMILIADLGRYWFHRLSHAWKPLWHLHAVHHAPEQLNALNVGRFHPFEKALQSFFDTLPFVLLGVSDTVVAAYLVFYAINGFFQHSNVDLKLGWFNWIVSGPELHRWHHARAPEISDHNFGNNLIIWDVLFGTRMLPREQDVGDLGLRNRSYPKGFSSQVLAPFTTNPNLETSK